MKNDGWKTFAGLLLGQTAYYQGRLLLNPRGVQLTQPKHHGIKVYINCIFPIKYVIPKSLKVGHWLSQTMANVQKTPNPRHPETTSISLVV